MNVLDHKKDLLRRYGESSHFGFIELSKAHRAAWKRLNAIGARGLDLDPVPPDIDAATEMTSAEIAEVERILSRRGFREWLRDQIATLRCAVIHGAINGWWSGLEGQWPRGFRVRRCALHRVVICDWCDGFHDLSHIRITFRGAPWDPADGSRSAGLR